MMRVLVYVAATFILMGISWNACGQTEVTLVAPGGIRSAIEQLVPGFEQKTGYKVKATFLTGGGSAQRVVRGEAFDVPIVQPPYPEVLASGNVVKTSATPLAAVAVGVAVKQGAHKPDISTPEAVKEMLLAAKSSAHASCGEILRQNEYKILIERSGAPPAHEILVASCKARPHRKLLKVEGKEKLLGVGAQTPGVGCAARAARDRYLLTRTRTHKAQRAKLLDRRPIPLTTGDIPVPVRSDVFLHGLPHHTLEALRQALEQGMTPSGLDFGGDDDDSIVVLRFSRPRG
jgi:hypothetical protein